MLTLLRAKDDTGVIQIETLFTLHSNNSRILGAGLHTPNPYRSPLLAIMPSGSDGADVAPLMENNPLGPFNLVPEAARSERPLLLPTGRKLRHLNGIALRNLTTQKGASRPRGISTDDDSLAAAWKSPSKNLSLQLETTNGKLEGESSAAGAVGLVHSKSSNDLPAEALERPKPRRRTTRGNPVRMENPILRQKRLEDVAAGRMADVFFTLHIPELGDEPIYISEVAHRSMNPNFQSFDLSACSPRVSRADSVVVKIWANTCDQFQFLLELDIRLASLRFIGKSLGNFRHPFPSNCIIFFLSDGIYTIITDLPVLLPRELRLGGHSMSNSVSFMACSSDHIVPTSSYDALMKLNNLEDCIQDAEHTAAKVSSQIDIVLDRESARLSAIKHIAQANERRNAVRKALAAEKKRLESSIRHRENLKNSLQSREEAMALGRETQKTGEKYLAEATVKLERCRNDLEETKKGLEGQKRRIIEDLQKVYPVESVSDQSLGFTIRGLYLPNKDHEDHDDGTISAALGYTAHLVYLLSFYLGTYLRYPVQPVGSNSFIRDPISVITGARTFPLWMKGSIYFRFEYAIFLLNKDIEQLMGLQSLWVMDLRNTLPNLKYLLLYITSGSGPVVERPSSPFIKMLRRKPSERSPNRGSSSRSGSPANIARRAISYDIPKRDFVEISDISGREVVYSTARLSNGNSNGVGK